jgi:hypothetical protein
MARDSASRGALSLMLVGAASDEELRALLEGAAP